MRYDHDYAHELALEVAETSPVTGTEFLSLVVHLRGLALEWLEHDPQASPAVIRNHLRERVADAPCDPPETEAYLDTAQQWAEALIPQQLRVAGVGIGLSERVRGEILSLVRETLLSQIQAGTWPTDQASAYARLQWLCRSQTLRIRREMEAELEIERGISDWYPVE